MQSHKEIYQLMNLFDKHGYEIYLVGGATRDILMNREPHDFDFCTNALPEEIISICEKENLKYFTSGIKHGTISILWDLYTVFEVTTYRIDGEYEDGRHPTNITFTKNIFEDLQRRDFTINAIAMNKDGKFTSCVDYISDIRKKRIKCVGSPNKRFQEDGLRILRAVRFAIQLDFTIETNTLQAMRDNIHLIDTLSAERIQSELTHILTNKNAYKFIRDYLFVWNRIIKRCNVAAYMNFMQEKIVELLYANSVYNIDSNSYYTINLFVLLDVLSYQKIKYVLTELRFPNITINNILALRSVSLVNIHNLNSIYPIRLFCMSHTQTTCKNYIDYKKITESPSKLYYIHNLWQQIDDVYKHDCISKQYLNINGNDLQEIGITGKDIGIVQDCLLHLVMQDVLQNTKSQLIEKAKIIMKKK